MKTIVTKRIAQDASLEGDTASSITGVRVQRSITISKSAEELYLFCRHAANLPRFMVRDAVVVDDIPNELISWRSLDDAEIKNTGAIVFKPASGSRGTIVTAMLTYDPPGGAFGDKIAALFGKDPQQQISENLHRFKAFMETGEIPTAAICPSAATAEIGR